MCHDRRFPSSATGGFTLTELLIAAVVIAVLSMIGIPKFTDMLAKSRDATTLGHLGAYRSALQTYYANNRIYPTPIPVPPVPSADLSLVPDYIDAIPRAHFGRHRGTSYNPSSPWAASTSINYAGSYPHPSGNRTTMFFPHLARAEENTVIQEKQCWKIYMPGGLGDRSRMQILVNCDHLNSHGVPWTTY